MTPSRSLVLAILAVCWLARPADAQPAPIADPFLDRLAGSWVLRGTVGKRATTHDVSVDWILEHEYLRIHEVSREKDAKGHPQYEAMVLVGWDASHAEYQCLWLDTTGGGGLAAPGIGHGKKASDAISFLFREPDGSASFNNTFTYEKDANAWAWTMDNVKEGKNVPFARLRLTRN